MSVAFIKVVTDVEIEVPFGSIAEGVGLLIGPFMLGSIINYFFQKKAVQG